MLKKIELFMERIIFLSRWIQLPIYLGLIVALSLYAFKFYKVLWHLFSHINGLSDADVMLAVLALVDVTMVANLLVMVIMGGYTTFVSKIHVASGHEDKPEWLEKVDAGTLKVKLAGSLVGVSGIHLLQTFVNIDHHQATDVAFQITIHVVFLISVLILAYSEKLLHSKTH